MAFNRGEEAYGAKNWDLAVDQYLKAIQSDPDNPRYRLSLAKALIEASNFHCKRAEEFVELNNLRLALIEFQKALDYFPENLRASKGKNDVLRKIDRDKKKSAEKTEIEKIKDKTEKAQPKEPTLKIDPETLLNFKFKNLELKIIFETLHKMSGLNILFDSAFQSKQVSIDLVNVTFKQAIDRLLLVSGLFYKVLDDQTILVIPDTPAKRKEYEELILRTFYISNADVNLIQTLLRSLANINTIAVNPELNSITLRESPQKIEIAEKIIATQDKSSAELLIDVEILEVNSSRLREYGIELSDYQITQSLVPETLSGDSSSLVRGHTFYNIDSSDFLFSIPSVSFTLLESDSDSRIIAKPQLRVLDSETVSVKLGDKVPIPVTTFVPIAVGGPSQQAITSYQMYDVGINIDITPRIHHNGDITLKLKFELTFITTPGTSIMPPTIGNRSVTTMLRIKDHETGLLAGLLRDQERKSWRGIPGLRDLPILSSIFGGNSKEISQTDLVLTLTPRITRMPDITEEDLISIWVGTESKIGLKAPPVSSLLELSRDEQENKKNVEEKKVTDKGTEDLIPREAIIYLSIDPSEVPGNTDFMMKVMAETVENASSIELSLNFDPEIIKIKEVQEGDFMSQDGVKTAFLKAFDNSTGSVQLSITRQDTTTGISGTGELVSVVLESIQQGGTTIAISRGSLRTPERIVIPVKLLDGKVIVE